jgi:hypothetical protein
MLLGSNSLTALSIHTDAYALLELLREARQTTPGPDPSPDVVLFVKGSALPLWYGRSRRTLTVQLMSCVDGLGS